MEAVLRGLVGKVVTLRLAGIDQWLNGELDIVIPGAFELFSLTRTGHEGIKVRRDGSEAQPVAPSRTTFRAEDVVFVTEPL